jgi:DNA-binding XRE family transcriptional regulator
VEHWIVSVFVALSMKTRLRILRAEKEWSQAELAAYVGVARGTINAIETGKIRVSR